MKVEVVDGIEGGNVEHILDMLLRGIWTSLAHNAPARLYHVIQRVEVVGHEGGGIPYVLPWDNLPSQADQKTPDDLRCLQSESHHQLKDRSPSLPFSDSLRPTK